MSSLHPFNVIMITKWIFGIFCICSFLNKFTFALTTNNDEGIHEELGYCAPYNGKVCKSHITTSQVWYSRVS